MIRVDGEREPDVFGVSLDSIVPACVRMNLESDRERIVRPSPAFSEARLEAGVADCIQSGADDSEVVVDHLGDLSSLCRDYERWKEEVGIGTDRDNQCAAGCAAGCAGARAWAFTTRADKKDQRGTMNRF